MAHVVEFQQLGDASVLIDELRVHLVNRALFGIGCYSSSVGGLHRDQSLDLICEHLDPYGDGQLENQMGVEKGKERKEEKERREFKDVGWLAEINVISLPFY